MALFKNYKHQFLFFLVLFFVINLLQSAYTGLLEDEAYYWVWSENLAWGYFDHPPMVAIFIWLGGLFSEGELGVRLMSTISFSLMVYLIWDTLDHGSRNNHVNLFFLLIISLALLQVYGFVSTPDTPLMLFTALFFWVYKKFLHNDSIKTALLLGLTMAALLYSKYHGVLIIGFVVLSNFGLLKNPRFWIACLFGLILYVPHLLWQYENGFPSFVYHLKERGHKPYGIAFTLNHLLNIIVVVGITFPVVYHAFIRKQAENPLERSYKFVVYGFALFFLLSSFRSQPQAQWLAATLIPLCILTFPYFIENEKSRKWLYRLGLAQLAIILVARILLSNPSLSPFVLEPHLAGTWVPELLKKTQGKPLVFINSYQNASVYRFYTGIDTHSYGIPRGRKSQYAMLNTEAVMQGKDVFGIGKQLVDHEFMVTKADQDLFGYEIDRFTSFQRINCIIPMKQLDMVPGKETRIAFKLINTYDQMIGFEKASFFAIFQSANKVVLDEIPLVFNALEAMEPREERELEAVFVIPDFPEIERQNTITLRIGVSFEDLPAGLQGNKVLVNFHPVNNQD